MTQKSAERVPKQMQAKFEEIVSLTDTLSAKSISTMNMLNCAANHKVVTSFTLMTGKANTLWYCPCTSSFLLTRAKHPHECE